MHAWISPESNIGAIYACRYFDVIECHLEIAVTQGVGKAYTEGTRSIFTSRSWEKHFRVAFGFGLHIFKRFRWKKYFTREQIFQSIIGVCNCVRDVAWHEAHAQNCVPGLYIQEDHFNIPIRILSFVKKCFTQKLSDFKIDTRWRQFIYARCHFRENH